ncbi:hypothetical protein Tsubulata_041469 [Turnera subulata]|uniref:Uncharacterized protein n=1 Tax=Turnera subulata TaxID=218843 RepID=A0A9Q0GBB3_9ROSI|nr:hypothetical protein Tsubulata_041469 [Turnera subulata]
MSATRRITSGIEKSGLCSLQWSSPSSVLSGIRGHDDEVVETVSITCSYVGLQTEGVSFAKVSPREL